MITYSTSEYVSYVTQVLFTSLTEIPCSSTDLTWPDAKGNFGIVTECYESVRIPYGALR